MAHDEGGSRSVRVVEMHSNDELRIEVGKKGPLRLRLLNGIANIVLNDYFYGIANDVTPHCTIANFNALFVYRLESAGSTEVSINDDLLHLVLAVSSANNPHDIISSEVVGFIYVTEIDMQRKKIRYITPLVELPSKNLIMGSLAWHDQTLLTNSGDATSAI